MKNLQELLHWQYLNGLEWAIESEALRFTAVVLPDVTEHIVYNFIRFEFDEIHTQQ